MKGKKMKKLLLVLFLLAIPMTVSAEEDNITWFVEGVYGFDIPEGWEYKELEMGELVFSNGSFSDDCFIIVTQPHPAGEFDLATYTGMRTGITFADLKELGEGSIVDETAQELDGNPGVIAQLAISKSGKNVLAGVVTGIDYGGYHVTFTVFAPPTEFQAFFEACGILMGSYEFDAEYAETYHETLKETGDQIEAALKKLMELGQE
jgi:hypothetical protein